MQIFAVLNITPYMCSNYFAALNVLNAYCNILGDATVNMYISANDMACGCHTFADWFAMFNFYILCL